VSLARALATGDLAQLPSRRDEDWRWSDLRGLIRQLPPPARATFAEATVGDALERCLQVPAAGAAHLARSEAIEGERVIVERYEAVAAGSIVDLGLDLALAEGAALERVVICDAPDDVVLVAQTRVRLAPGARFRQTVLTSGGRRQRLETQVEHPGQGAFVRLDGIYLNRDQRHSDITTVVDHHGVGGSTDQLVKGVVDGQARGVFQGRIIVQPGADKTDARMGHHALILSDRAEVDAKPELLIEADDVACAHGNTVGALDEEAIFYARQRGIPEAEARAMLTAAFIGEVIDRIEHAGAREAARTWAAAKLGGGDGV
jgi:Fe-S cluster assembly protein SufD